MINRKKPVLKADSRIWKPKSKVWFQHNSDKNLGRDDEYAEGRMDEFGEITNAIKKQNKEADRLEEGLRRLRAERKAKASYVDHDFINRMEQRNKRNANR